MEDKEDQQLFHIKDENMHPVCKVYEGICSCNVNYIGETKRNVEIRWQEHNDIRRDSEPAKHLKENPDHVFKWNILMSAPINLKIRKILESYTIKVKRPILNDQLENNLILFKNGVT